MKDSSMIAAFGITFALFVCCVGLMSSCNSDCRHRGGVLVRGVFGYECVRGAGR